jgi:hypothetical protein
LANQLRLPKQKMFGSLAVKKAAICRGSYVKNSVDPTPFYPCLSRAKTRHSASETPADSIGPVNHKSNKNPKKTVILGLRCPNQTS